MSDNDKQTFLTYDAASSSVQTSPLTAPRRDRRFGTGCGGVGDTSSRSSGIGLQERASLEECA